MELHPSKVKKLKELKKDYADLPWYQRAWFFIWSFQLRKALFSIDSMRPTQEQVNALLNVHETAWFFKSIFGLLNTELKDAIKEKPFQFANLTDALLIKIGTMLPSEDISHLIQASKCQAKLFQPVINVNSFLEYVTQGNYEKVEEMLNQDPTLITRKGNVRDFSGRSFSGISGFQYSLWALDKHMWTRMLTCILNNKQGEQIKAELLLQYQGIIKAGITYTLNGTKRTEPHFDFENTIIKELKARVDYANGQNPNWNAIDNQWRVGVGGAQRLLPMHVVYEYCSDEPFYPKPSFKTQPTLKTQFYNWITNVLENWFHLDSKLGVDFAIYKDLAPRGQCAAAAEWWRGLARAPRADLAAITALYEIRTADFNALGTELGYHSDDQQLLVSHCS